MITLPHPYMKVAVLAVALSGAVSVSACSSSHKDSETPDYADRNKACGAQLMAIADTIVLHRGDVTGLKNVLKTPTPLLTLAPQMAADLTAGKFSAGSPQDILNRLSLATSISCTAGSNPVLTYGQVRDLKAYASGADGKLLDAVMPSQ